MSHHFVLLCPNKGTVQGQLLSCKPIRASDNVLETVPVQDINMVTTGSCILASLLIILSDL